MRTVAGAATSDGFGDDFFGLLGGARLATGVDLRELFSQSLRQLMLLLVGEGRGKAGSSPSS